MSTTMQPPPRALAELPQHELEHVIQVIAAAFGAYERLTGKTRDIDGFVDAVAECLLYYEAGIERPTADDLASFFSRRFVAWEHES